ncbi:MAG TPA: gamma-glutamyl-phosphate reductase, partial [Planctomycetaceae bacterium]|nr:gamma-glutamyl-phosphate reductase [Planctomycetaceae bacterium]
MSETKVGDLAAVCRQMGQAAKAASRKLAILDTAVKNRWLIASANRLIDATDEIIAANSLDLDAAPGFGLTDAAIDRLRLDATRIAAIAQGLREVAALPDPVGEVMEGFTRPGGLQILKKRVPLGVVFFIYESRPNVTADAAAICVKSGNAVILRGGKEAIHSSQKIIDLLTEVGDQCDLPAGAVQLVATTDRDAVGQFLKMNESIDVT